MEHGDYITLINCNIELVSRRLHVVGQTCITIPSSEDKEVSG